MSAPRPRVGVEKMGPAGDLAAAERALPAASNILRLAVSAATWGTAAIEKWSESVA